MAATNVDSFSKETLTFLQDLKKNNSKPWFVKNKARYEARVKEPGLAFIRAFGPKLAKIHPDFVADARPVGGSFFRIYRDTRFSKDKSPLKTNIGLHFRHKAGKDAHAPGFYLHIEPDQSFAASGIWHPDSPSLLKIRQHIVDWPKAWTGVRSKVKNLEGESLKTTPKGFDPEHPLIEDLRRKDFIAVEHLSDAQVSSPTLLSTFEAASKRMLPLTQFLLGALDLDG
jgi:uncharacterized protein (TIGR02453 family)